MIIAEGYTQILLFSKLEREEIRVLEVKSNSQRLSGPTTDIGPLPPGNGPVDFISDNLDALAQGKTGNRLAIEGL